MSVQRTKTLIPMETVIGVINLTIEGVTRTFQIYYGGALNPWFKGNMLIAPNDVYESKLKDFFENDGQEYIIPSKTEIASVCAEVRNNYVKGLYHDKQENIVNDVIVPFMESEESSQKVQVEENTVEPIENTEDAKEQEKTEEDLKTEEDESIVKEEVIENSELDSNTNIEVDSFDMEEKPIEINEEENTIPSIQEIEEIIKQNGDNETTENIETIKNDETVEDETKDIQEEAKNVVIQDKEQIEELKAIISNQNIMIASLNETIVKQNESIVKINENIELLKKKNKGSIGSNTQKKTYIAVLLSTIVIISIIVLSQMYLPKMESAIKLENNTDAEVHIVIHNKDGSDTFERIGSISVQNGKIVTNNKN